MLTVASSWTPDVDTFEKQVDIMQVTCIIIRKIGHDELRTGETLKGMLLYYGKPSVITL